MERRDIIKDEIEQVSRILAKILADFVGAKSRGSISEAIEISNQQLLSQLDIKVEEVLSLRDDDLRNYIGARNLTAEHLEVLSEYLRESGLSLMDDNNQASINNLELSIHLLDIADETSGTFCFSRMEKKSKLIIKLRNQIDHR